MVIIFISIQLVEDFQQRAVAAGSEDAASVATLQKCEELLPGEVFIILFIIVIISILIIYIIMGVIMCIIIMGIILIITAAGVPTLQKCEELFPGEVCNIIIIIIFIIYIIMGTIIIFIVVSFSWERSSSANQRIANIVDSTR